MKRIASIIMIVTVLFAILCACESKGEKEAREAQEYANEVNERYQDQVVGTQGGTQGDGSLVLTILQRRGGRRKSTALSIDSFV